MAIDGFEPSQRQHLFWTITTETGCGFGVEGQTLPLIVHKVSDDTYAQWGTVDGAPAAEFPGYQHSGTTFSSMLADPLLVCDEADHLAGRDYCAPGCSLDDFPNCPAVPEP